MGFFDNKKDESKELTEEITEFIVKDKTSYSQNGYGKHLLMDDKNHIYIVWDHYLSNMFTWKNIKIGDTVCMTKQLRGESRGLTLFEIVER
jgi:hypothetical protein